jgi:hypothetical protein
MAFVCSLAAIHSAAAQPAPAVQPMAQPAPATGAAEPAAPVDPPAGPGGSDPQSAVDARSDAAWQLYHDAFTALMHGEQTRARNLASALLRDHPEHPATQLVRGAHLGLAPGAVDQPQSREVRETASRGARAELALFQSLNGIALGIEGCLALECDSGSAYLGVALVGGAIGAWASLSLHDLTSGERALLNSGTAWGAVNASLVLTMLDSPDAPEAALTLIAGQSGGLLAGASLFSLRPTAGQVALANSGGEWVGVLTELVIAASGAHLSNDVHAFTALVAIDAGIAAGAYLSSRWRGISRAQTLVIDAGGIVGGVGGGGIGILISGDADARATPAFAAVGAVIGLGAAAYFTRDWSEGSASSVHAYLAPPERGRGGLAGIGFRW